MCKTIDLLINSINTLLRRDVRIISFFSGWTACERYFHRFLRWSASHQTHSNYIWRKTWSNMWVEIYLLLIFHLFNMSFQKRIILEKKRFVYILQIIRSYNERISFITWLCLAYVFSAFLWKLSKIGSYPRKQGACYYLQ